MRWAFLCAPVLAAAVFTSGSPVRAHADPLTVKTKLGKVHG
jgi:hypothetical protein